MLNWKDGAGRYQREDKKSPIFITFKRLTIYTFVYINKY